MDGCKTYHFCTTPVYFWSLVMDDNLSLNISQDSVGYEYFAEKQEQPNLKEFKREFPSLEMPDILKMFDHRNEHLPSGEVMDAVHLFCSIYLEQNDMEDYYNSMDSSALIALSLFVEDFILKANNDLNLKEEDVVIDEFESE